MEELIRQFVINAPMTAILIYMLQRLYNDWQQDRIAARDERATMLEMISKLERRIDKLSTSLNVLAEAILEKRR